MQAATPWPILWTALTQEIVNLVNGFELFE